jgi:NADH-quinone oxidoreductase subunit L
MKGLHTLLLNKYYLDEIYAFLFRDGLRSLGSFLWKVGDVKLIDGVLVNGSAWAVGQVARLSRQLQSGYLYTYAFTMLIGVLGLLVLWLVRTRAVF